jgi:phenylpyruvate tautomerase PptA (4-oxalocrotonate tautomerase family)
MSVVDSLKVPSVLAYNSKAEVASWGFSLHRNRVEINCFKLLLSEQATEELAKSRPNEHKKLQAKLEKLEKEPSDVVGDYLRCLWHHVVENIKEKIGNLLWENLNLKIMLTIPTIWDHKAQAMLRRSAEKAGLLERTGTLLELVGKPEAAAVAVLSEMQLQRWGNLKVSRSYRYEVYQVGSKYFRWAIHSSFVMREL